MADLERPEASRIAIRFGGSSVASVKKSARPPPPSSSLGKRHRPSHELGGSSDHDSEDDSHDHGRYERITAFGENGAELANGERNGRNDRRPAKRGPLTIERQANRDWRSVARLRNQRENRQPNHRSGTETSETEKEKETEGLPRDEVKPLQWGLSRPKKASQADDDDDEKHSRDNEEASNNRMDSSETGVRKDAIRDNELSAEREAINALLGESINDKTGTRRVIDRAANESTEDDVFARDFNDAPDVSTLEDYEAMPVEDFGAALLRGMGWDGKDRGPKVKQVVRRPNQMGLGAKELKGDEDLGEWNHKLGGNSSSSRHKQRPPKLHDYRRDEYKKRENQEQRHRDSYKSERDRERNSQSSSSRHLSRHRR
ncbi:DNA primase large subunit Spp2 [Sporothrix epigloea]|uniref:Pre-mRNA-splicing factor n=1 Tax=Sporothrix epigloea TaxID=1892477 RepID=A0ABP0DLQ8_9PEZI